MMTRKVSTIAAVLVTATLLLAGMSIAASHPRPSSNSVAVAFSHSSYQFLLCQNSFEKEVNRLTVTRNRPPNPTTFSFPTKMSGVNTVGIRHLATGLCELPLDRTRRSCTLDSGTYYTLDFSAYADPGPTFKKVTIARAKPTIVDPSGCQTVTGLGGNRWVGVRPAPFWSLFGSTIGLHHVTGATFVGTPGRALTPPYCRTFQLSVFVAPSYTNRHTGNLFVDITFTNKGRTCQLESETPDVATVVGAKHTPVGSGLFNSIPYVGRIVLTRGRSVLSVLSVIRTIADAKGCQPITADGLVIVDGLPIGSSRYVHYVVKGVCSSATHPNLMQGIYGQPVLRALAYVKGTVEECSPMGNLLRPLTVTLHRADGGVAASAKLGPSSTYGSFLLKAPPGTYYLSVSDPTDIISNAARHIRLSPREVFTTHLATSCQ